MTPAPTLPPEIPAVTDVELAFGTTRALPPPAAWPAGLNGSHPAVQYVEALFFDPQQAQRRFILRCRFEMTQAQGQAAFNLVLAHLRSCAPKHEHKVLGCAALLDRYFTVHAGSST
ncbi:hypothetical protein [Deinococcus multiflagellatus]|uniref:hypothetical protein n=1 Tax=Deinococcus multiflagellatus TaxID=1656887 RepID=UPI001CCF23F1|nr:hypothetical protein [Deinococcus multiflagellatus]MBZ9715624.1 hypothetical protein [Deinococcus multiflagellatus]